MPSRPLNTEKSLKNDNRARLRTIKVAFEDTGIVLGHIVCCNGYRGKLRSVRVM